MPCPRRQSWRAARDREEEQRGDVPPRQPRVDGDERGCGRRPPLSLPPRDARRVVEPAAPLVQQPEQRLERGAPLHASCLKATCRRAPRGARARLPPPQGQRALSCVARGALAASPPGGLCSGRQLSPSARVRGRRCAAATSAAPSIASSEATPPTSGSHRTPLSPTPQRTPSQ